MIQPMLIAVVPQVVRTTGAEDSAELVQDGMCMAAQAIEKLENQGKDLMPRSVAYYTIQRLKSGRRSQYAGRMDAMCPGATLDKKVEIADMEATAHDETGEELTFGEMLASGDEDAATLAARDIDWSLIEPLLTVRELKVLQALVEGRGTNEIAFGCQVSAPAITQAKRRIGQKISASWGDGMMREVGRVPTWRAGLRAARAM
ncbi:MAG: LuxR C-terminal-related transcriptional regulator [Kiritimatiellaeota bacterium]|nr:LuxR C-terminal-related transcriptional regulator [Kiritimatiellota bacterium]